MCLFHPKWNCRWVQALFCLILRQTAELSKLESMDRHSFTDVSKLENMTALPCKQMTDSSEVFPSLVMCKLYTVSLLPHSLRYTKHFINYTSLITFNVYIYLITSVEKRVFSSRHIFTGVTVSFLACHVHHNNRFYRLKSNS